MKRIFLLLASVVALASSLVLAQAPTPGQSAASTPPKSTALIIGQIVDGSSGQPVPEAIVTLSGGRGGAPVGAPQIGNATAAAAGALVAAAATTGRAAAGPAPQRVMTGADGRFVFHDLPPGQFQLTATLTGYTGSLNTTPAGAAGAGAAAAALLAAAAPTSPTPIALREGEVATGVRLRLWKTAVVSGTVVDDGGEPAIGIKVQVARRVMMAGRARYLPGSSVTTDDRGAYRISSLVPGDYLVVVPQTQTSIPTAVMTGLIDSLTGGGAGPGGGLALLDMMSSGINPNDAMSGGVRIGDYMVASSGSVPLTGPDGRLLAYQTLFYPDVGAPAQASMVSLKSGDDRTDVNFHLRLIATARVSGTATGPEGPAGNLGVRLVVPADGAGSESEFDVATTVTRADGTFAFHGVPPGQFLLRAQKQPRPAIPAELLASPLLQMMFGNGGAQAPTDALFAATSVTVGDGDVDGVALQLAAGFRAIGKVEFENPSGRQTPAANQVQSITVSLSPMDGRGPEGTGGLAFGVGGLSVGFGTGDRANAQGEFRTKGYAPGKYFLSASTVGTWLVKSATVNGRDVLDAPLEIRDADVAGIVVTYADEFARLSGTITSAGETDLSETSISLFPANYRAWIENGMNPRRARTVRASRTGAYLIANVPPGEYLAAAIDRANEGDMQDPAFIEVLSRAGTRVVLATTPRTLDLVKVPVVR